MNMIIGLLKRDKKSPSLFTIWNAYRCKEIPSGGG